MAGEVVALRELAERSAAVMSSCHSSHEELLVGCLSSAATRTRAVVLQGHEHCRVRRPTDSVTVQARFEAGATRESAGP